MVTHSSILAWKNPTDRGALWVAVHGIAELDMTEHLSIIGKGMLLVRWKVKMI